MTPASVRSSPSAASLTLTLAAALLMGLVPPACSASPSGPDGSSGQDPGPVPADRADPDGAPADRNGPDGAGPDAGPGDAGGDGGPPADAIGPDLRSDGPGPDGDDPCSRPRPGPTTTGVPAGTTLTPSGSITVDQDGAVVEDLDIEGTITVLANDVTIRRVRLRTDDYYPVRYFDNDNTGLLVEDSEIEGLSGDVTSAIAFANYTARRLNVHGMADGFKADSNVLIEDCWIHDLSNGPDEHNDGVQSTGGPNVTLRHNDISGASNACVQTGDEGGTAAIDLHIECNWLSGGGYTLNIRGSKPTLPMGTRVTGNRFGRDHGYGPWTFDDPAPVVTGNVYDDNDEPIPFP